MLLGVAPSIPFSDPRLQRPHGEGGDDDRLQTFLAQARANTAVLRAPDSAGVLSREIGRRLFSLLLKADQEEAEISLGLGDLGLDSMVAVEMRAWWKQVFGSDISVLQMMAMWTLEALGKRAADELIVKCQG
ncbi:putative polyketide synthase [Diaporthe ampelina]|uniref:Putative polyketide synthase n=1 Tax=Diaporthe ampelina TaxID=1214573 RepID=A0A0G2FAB7_9PEZI|nr:putative polyketide synthase [Diaporthe ampelina]